MRDIIKHIQEDQDIFKPASEKDLEAREAARKAESKKKLEDFKKTYKQGETAFGKQEGICPVCGSDDLEYTDTDEYPEEIEHEFVCRDCECVGNDLFNKIYRGTEVLPNDLPPEITGKEW